MKSRIENGKLILFDVADSKNGKFVVPSGITQIGNLAFEDCLGLTEVVVPNNVQQIGAGAFNCCKELTKVCLPNNLSKISTEMFYNCVSLKKIEFPTGLKKINESAFIRCEALENITIPDGVTSIGESAFLGCDGLKTVKLPNNLTIIAMQTFCDCLNLKEITIPDKVESIGISAFNSCHSLTNVNFGKGLEHIDNMAFYGCSSLINLKMPDNLLEIGNQSFRSCKNLQNVELNNKLRLIEYRAFQNCAELKNINLPDSIVSINDNAFYDCVSLQKIKLPKNLEKVNYCVFYNCTNLKEVEFNENLKTIEAQAFALCESLEKIKLPSSLSVLEYRSFWGCESLRVVEMSSNIKRIFRGVFSSCPKLETLILDGKKIKIDRQIRENFELFYDFLCYAIKNNKFIPKRVGIMAKTNKNEIENFYKHSKEWKNVLTAYMQEWKDNLKQKEQQEIDLTIENLYQVSTAMGLFQDGEDGIRAQEFINNVIIKMSPEVLHELFGALNTKDNGYIKEYADFYIKNYKSKDADGLYLLERIEYDDFADGAIVGYTSKAYNNWKKVKEAYPNKTVLAHREQGSENNNLSEEDIFNALTTTIFENVDEGNEEMAELVGKYGYTQTEFEELQKWWNEAKTTKQEDVILTCQSDTSNQGITFELLKKDNPEQLILGEKTNCCQTVNDAGASCVEYGLKAKNSGFIKFSHNGRIIGQSWVWYNPETKVVCLDNIEIPTIWKKQLKKDGLDKEFLDCLKRLAVSIKTQMEKEGKGVKGVTVGAGYNDLAIVQTLTKINGYQSPLPSDYSGYSDATATQFIIPMHAKTKQVDEPTK